MPSKRLCMLLPAPAAIGSAAPVQQVKGARQWPDLESFELVVVHIKVARSPEAQEGYARVRRWMVISQHTLCARPKNGG